MKVDLHFGSVSGMSMNSTGVQTNNNDTHSKNHSFDGNLNPIVESTKLDGDIDSKLTLDHS